MNAEIRKVHARAPSIGGIGEFGGFAEVVASLAFFATMSLLLARTLAPSSNNSTSSFVVLALLQVESAEAPDMSMKRRVDEV